MSRSLGAQLDRENLERCPLSPVSRRAGFSLVGMLWIRSYLCVFAPLADEALTPPDGVVKQFIENLTIWQSLLCVRFSVRGIARVW
jgi:hypothetical protein